jgi:hypothetical protein
MILARLTRPSRHVLLTKARADLRAFLMATFGLLEASLSKEGQPGYGLNVIRDVTDLYTRLSHEKNWDRKALRLSFVSEPWGDYPVKITIGRASLVIECL